MRAAAEDQPLLDHTALVTGATSGIGHHTACALARLGARVTITGRTRDTGEQAATAIRRESGTDSVTFLQADHSTVGGNQDLADRVRATLPHLHLLLNNVGGLYPNRRETPDGYEATLAMNFVGPYALTSELLPLLRASAPSRCVNVVSAGFKMWNTDPFTDIHSTDRFVSGDAYAHTKLLNVLACLAWARRLNDDHIAVNLVHPGLSWTQMTQSMTAQTIPSLRLVWPLLRLLQRRGSPAKAGHRVAFVAASPQTFGYTGQYFESHSTPRRLSPRELDPQNQDRAWHLGAELMANAPTRHPQTAGSAAGAKPQDPTAKKGGGS
jgi:NAD(P)-dependent dehydrogenase (short-subunit alcohol dehydrogenase family)